MPTSAREQADSSGTDTREERRPESLPTPRSDEQTEALFNSLYTALHRLARREVRRNGADGVLGTGTLVHEAWLDMSKRPALDFDQPGRFLAYAARTMRGLVVDRVRARHAEKRGGKVEITALDTLNADQVVQPVTLEGIAEALEELERIDAELANVVDLKFFCGFTFGEIAKMYGVSERTVQRQWEKARILLQRSIS